MRKEKHTIIYIHDCPDTVLDDAIAEGAWATGDDTVSITTEQARRIDALADLVEGEDCDVILMGV